MANRWFQQFRYSLEKQVVDLYASVAIGASGAPTIGTAKGIASISRTAAGAYTVTLQDTYYRLLGMKAFFKAGSMGPAAPVVSVVSEDVDGAKTINILCQNGGSDADPASGETLYLQFSLSNSGSL